MSIKEDSLIEVLGSHTNGSRMAVGLYIYKKKQCNTNDLRSKIGDIYYDMSIPYLSNHCVIDIRNGVISSIHDALRDILKLSGWIKPDRHGEEWSCDEEDHLCKLYIQDMPWNSIAAEHQRTVSSVNSQYKKIKEAFKKSDKGLTDIQRLSSKHVRAKSLQKYRGI